VLSCCLHYDKNVIPKQSVHFQPVSIENDEKKRIQTISSDIIFPTLSRIVPTSRNVKYFINGMTNGYID
jgi:hypothetical protein